MPKKKNDDVKDEIKKIVKKKKRKVYFGQEVQNAVVEYNSSTNFINLLLIQHNILSNHRR